MVTDTDETLAAALADRYVIDHQVGAGAMATVYVAEDVKHRRRVALKVLRSELSAILGVERFLKEIEVTAGLQHPNIVPLFDSGEVSGRLYFVMPFVEGGSLRAKLQRERQLPVSETVQLGVAVARALDYAHKRGVVHRDLKPENILLHDGQPLVADFGIALAVSDAAGERLTQTGISLGTPQYMSPEQATGDRQIDARSDIYSLGTILYEMLTGAPPHTGPNAHAVLARIVTEDVRAIRDIRSTVPFHVEAAIERALAKTPADRFATAGEFAAALEGGGTGIAPFWRARGRRLGWPLAAAGVVAALFVGAGIMRVAAAVRTTPMVGPTTFFVNSPRAGRFIEPSPAISPDGRMLVFASTDSTGQAQLWLRPLDKLTATPLAGTEDGIFPFWSPRSDAIGFFSRGKLRIVPVTGGPAQAIGDAPRAWGGSWSDDDVIVFSPDLRSPLYAISARGGERRQVTRLSEPSVNQSGPSFLPDGKHFLYAVESDLYLGSLDDSTTTRLLSGALNAVATLDGWVLFVEDGVLKAQRLDVAARQLSGPRLRITDPARASFGSTISVSRNGVVAYLYGTPANRQLTWVDRAGHLLSRIGPPGAIDAPVLSRDETKVAFGRDGHIWIADLSRPSSATQLTRGTGWDFYPVWSPDGHQIVFASTRTAPDALYIQSANGLGDARRLTETGPGPFDWSADGRFITYCKSSGGDRAFLLRMADTTPMPFLETARFNVYEHRLSRDDKWIVYTTEESGTPEVWLQAFPTSETRVQVSTASGVQPMWAGNGRQIYYLSLTGAVMVADVELGPKPRVGVPQKLFQFNGDILYARSSYAPTRDGGRFLINSYVDVDRPTIAVVTNWQSLITKR